MVSKDELGRMKDELGRMKDEAPCRDDFFPIHPSSFSLQPSNDATALDLLWFNRLMGKPLTAEHVERAKGKLERYASELIKELGFFAEVRGNG